MGFRNLRQAATRSFLERPFLISLSCPQIQRNSTKVCLFSASFRFCLFMSFQFKLFLIFFYFLCEQILLTFFEFKWLFCIPFITSSHLNFFFLNNLFYLFIYFLGVPVAAQRTVILFPNLDGTGRSFSVDLLEPIKLNSSAPSREYFSVYHSSGDFQVRTNSLHLFKMNHCPFFLYIIFF